MKKLVKFNEDLIEKIQAYADKHLEGNFSMAVRYLCVTGIKSDDEK